MIFQSSMASLIPCYKHVGVTFRSHTMLAGVTSWRHAHIDSIPQPDTKYCKEQDDPTTVNCVQEGSRARQVTDLLVLALSGVQARLEEVPKDDGAPRGEQVLGAANSTAQVLAHHVGQDAPQPALVLIVHQAVVEDTQAFMQPQAHQGQLAVALFGAGHHHTLQASVWV